MFQVHNPNRSICYVTILLNGPDTQSDKMTFHVFSLHFPVWCAPLLCYRFTANKARGYSMLCKKRDNKKVVFLRKNAAFLQIYICKNTVPIYNKRFPHLYVKKQFSYRFIFVKIRSCYIYNTDPVFLRKKAAFLQIYFCKNPVPKYTFPNVAYQFRLFSSPIQLV